VLLTRQSHQYFDPEYALDETLIYLKRVLDHKPLKMCFPGLTIAFCELNAEQPLVLIRYGLKLSRSG